MFSCEFAAEQRDNRHSKEEVASPVLLLCTLCHTASCLGEACLAAVTGRLMPSVPSKAQVGLPATDKQKT